MSGTVNKAIVIGYLGADPEVKTNSAGRLVARFSLATTESWRDRTSGERRERTDWHRVVVFNEDLAKIAQHHLKKGSKVYAEGQMQTREWDDGGVRKFITEVVLNGFNARLTMLDRIGGRPPGADSPEDYGGGPSLPSHDDDPLN